MKNIVVLTGAGISAESGVPTFRDQNGLWEGHRVEEVATPEAFAHNPQLVHTFYNLRRTSLAIVEPNAAHLALARLERALGEQFTLVTQNVDDLHERAGNASVIHMHGELRRVFCTRCGERLAWQGDTGVSTECPACKSIGSIRPDIVWFGEMPYHMDMIEEKLSTCDLFVAIGTSGVVYPAAGFVQIARMHGADTLELNNTHTEATSHFARQSLGPATTTVTAWAEEVLGG